MLTAIERKKGFQNMKEGMSAAARVRRALKVGAKARLTTESVSVLEAAQRLAVEADKARGAMHKEGLDPDDIHLALAYAMPEAGGFGHRWLPAPGQIGAFITGFEQIAAQTPVGFLGVLWCQRDRESDVPGKEPCHVLWVTQWMAGPLVAPQLKALRDMVTHPGN